MSQVILKDFLLMDAESNYNELLQMVEPLIEKQTTNMHQTISHAESFSITLRYLATGKTNSGRQMIFLHNLIDGHHRRSINCAIK